MKYTEEIFNILSRGGFISANSVSSTVKRYYDALEEDFTEYYDYYKGIGFYLEAGNGYYLFTRQETRVDLERKLEAVGKWIDYLSFLKTYHSAFGPGFLTCKKVISVTRFQIEADAFIIIVILRKIFFKRIIVPLDG
jgi:hypothetical protein